MVIRGILQLIVVSFLMLVALFAYSPALELADNVCEPLVRTEPIAKWYAYRLNQLIRRNIYRVEFPIMSKTTLQAIIRYLLDSDEITPSEAKMMVRAAEQLAIYKGKVYTVREFGDIQFVVDCKSVSPNL